MEQFELEDEEWEEVLAVVRAEAEKRGINQGDFAEMLVLMKRIWKVLANPGQRNKKIVHAKHKQLTKAKEDLTSNLQMTSDELAALPNDPGDPIPDRPKPVVVPEEVDPTVPPEVNPERRPTRQPPTE